MPGRPDGTTQRSVQAIHRRQGLAVRVSEPQEASGPPDGHDWLGGRLAVRAYGQLDLYAPEAGRFVIRDVPMAPGENRLVAWATDPATGLRSADSETVLVTVPEEAFADLAVAPEGVVSLPPVPLAARPAQLRVRVENRGDRDAGATEQSPAIAVPVRGVRQASARRSIGVTMRSVFSARVTWAPPITYGRTAAVASSPHPTAASSAQRTARFHLVMIPSAFRWSD